MHRIVVVGLVVIVAVMLLVVPTFLSDTPTDGTEASGPDGATLYLENCAVCHGTYGEGDGAAAPELSVTLHDLRYIAARGAGIFPRAAM